MKSKKEEKKSIKGIGISSREKSEFQFIRDLIEECDPKIKVFHFEDIIHRPEILEKIDFLITIGGDGSVAWFVGAFYNAFDNISNIKPIIPVVRPESVGYLKQLDFDKVNFIKGFNKLLRGEFEVIQRTVLKAFVNKERSISVNEVMMTCNPHLGKFTINIEKDDGIKEVIAEIYADGVMIVTAIGSTAWAMSHGGLLNLDEEALEIIFIGAMHGGANYIIPRKGKIHLNLELKNPVITKETVFAYNQAREKSGLLVDKKSRETLRIVYSSQVLVDGKVVDFGSKDVSIDPNCSIPFVIIKDHSPYEKARQLTKNIHIKK